MKSNGNRYTVKEWAKWKADYESGKYESLQELRKSCVKAGIKAPSHRAFQERAAKEHWDKNRQKPELEEIEAEKWRRLAAEIGMDDKAIANEIIGMIKTDNTYSKKEGLRLLFDLTGSRAPSKISKTDPSGNESKMPDTVILLPKNGFEAVKA